MTLETPTPQPGSLRPSDLERERAVRELRERAAEGRLSHDTFIERLERAYATRDRRELDDLVDDLPRPRSGTRRLIDAVTTISTLATRIQAAWQEPRLPWLLLPEGHLPLRIGRTRECGLILNDPTVSRVHAELRRRGEDWFLVDLGSTNGTLLNGRRITAPVAVRPHDQVSFGLVSYRIAE